MVQNQQLAEQIFLIMNTLVDMSNELKNALDENDRNKFKSLSEDLYMAVKSIGELAPALKEEESGLSLPAAVESVKWSLLRIISLEKTDVQKASHKVEFELTPLIEEMRVNFYWWGMVYPDEQRMEKYYKDDIFLLGGNKYTALSEERGEYKYDLSIIVIGYNKIDYTKICLENLYKNLPKELSYEIILLNHGSTDETKETFEQCCPDKQLDIAVNGGGSNAVNRIAEGKYFLVISNDVIITPNAIDNLYKCISSDEKIAWVVPTTPNVSNLQTIPATYNSYEEMIEFARKNNVTDSYRWEQRVRLCNPVEIVRANFLEKTRCQYVFHSKNRMSFPDDKRSLICRRNGYKTYLAKDAYCYHYGSVTLAKDNSTNSKEAFAVGREDFYNVFGIDPWHSSFCYNHNLFQFMPLIDKEKVHILGINCGLGSNPLKVKETLKEVKHNKNCYIHNILSDETFLEDVKTVSDSVTIGGLSLDSKTELKKYDYIIDESIVYDIKQFRQTLETLESLLKESGVICVLASKEVSADMNEIQNKKYEVILVDNSSVIKNSIWVVLRK